MNLPESINKLTSETISDQFKLPQQTPELSADEIIFFIKSKLTPRTAKYFEEGLAYYKSSTNVNTLFAGLMSLYSENVRRAIKNSQAEEFCKVDIINHVEGIIKTITQLFQLQHTLVNNSTETKKSIDAEEISYIILGYAIETIKKIHHTKSQ